MAPLTNTDVPAPTSIADVINAGTRGEVPGRDQPWKSVWPPTEDVKPANEKSRAGQMRVLYAGGGAYPNFIKSTEGVRL